jgi:hypothetical protein
MAAFFIPYYFFGNFKLYDDWFHFYATCILYLILGSELILWLFFTKRGRVPEFKHFATLYCLEAFTIFIFYEGFIRKILPTRSFDNSDFIHPNRYFPTEMIYVPSMTIFTLIAFSALVWIGKNLGGDQETTGELR